MKILIINCILTTAEKGVITPKKSIWDCMISTFARGFIELGHQVTLLASQEFKPTEEENLPFEVIYFPSRLPQVFKPSLLPWPRGMHTWLKQHADYYGLVIASESFQISSLMAARVCGPKLLIWQEMVRHQRLLFKLPSKFWHNVVFPLFLHGANVDMSDNKIVSTTTTDPYTGKDTGVQLVCCGTEGGIVTMRNNVCKGIMCISTVGAGDGTKHFTINAYNNYFAGDTRIYCNKINRLNINFTGNTLVSRGMNFFLQEFAKDGTVVFNNNDVTVSRSNGQLMTHWSKISTDAMKFERLEVKNNVFRDVNSEKDLLKTITKVKKRIVQSNSVLR